MNKTQRAIVSVMSRYKKMRVSEVAKKLDLEPVAVGNELYCMFRLAMVARKKEGNRSVRYYLS